MFRTFRRVSIRSKLGYFLLQINGFYIRSSYGSKNDKRTFMVIIKIVYVFSGGLLQNWLTCAYENHRIF